jgi:hypothetical protein
MTASDFDHACGFLLTRGEEPIHAAFVGNNANYQRLTSDFKCDLMPCPDSGSTIDGRDTTGQRCARKRAH